MSPQNHGKIKGFGHLKTRLFTIKTPEDCRFWGPMAKGGRNVASQVDM